MNRHAPRIDSDGEVRELTAADMKKFRPAREVLPLAVQKTLGLHSSGSQNTPANTAERIPRGRRRLANPHQRRTARSRGTGAGLRPAAYS